MRKMIAAVLVIVIAFAGVTGLTVFAGSEDAAPSFEIELPERQESSFLVRTETINSVIYDEQSNTYTIVTAGEFDCYGNLYEGQLLVAADDNAEVTVHLNGCVLTNSAAAPFCALSAGKVSISAKTGTQNIVYDLRPAAQTDAEEAMPAAIYAACDLTMKGKGSLTVVSNAFGGLRTKDDLVIKNLTLAVKAAGAALRGSDSVTIESGNVTAVSLENSAIKTANTSASKKGVLRGAVQLSGGTIRLYAAHNGINSASDVIICEDAALEIYTDEYSPYAPRGSASAKEKLYLRLDQTLASGYRFSAYFYNTDGSGRWENAQALQESASSGAQNRGGKNGWDRRGGGMSGSFGLSAYTYYAVPCPEGYEYVRFYAYAEGQAQGQAQSYAAVSDEDLAIPDVWDTYAAAGISGSTLVSSGWTSYAARAGASGPENSCKGIKAGNSVLISGGAVTIYAKDDGIHANFDDVMEATGQNGLGNVQISGGRIVITSSDDGIHADQDLIIDGGSVNVVASYEGLEANRIYIRGGEVTLNASDDAINANSKGDYAAYIEISGGKLDAAVPNGDTDTMDSNGTILISGGFVFLKNGQTSGSSFTGGTIDTERGVSVTGGTVIAIGCIGDQFKGAVGSSGLTFESGEYAVLDADGETVISFALSNAYRGCLLYSERFISGQSYALAMNGETIASFTY